MLVMGLCSLRMCTCAVDNKRVDLVIESGWWHSRRESGKKEFGKEKKGKKGKSGLREKSVFLLLCDCVFHSILSPFQSTMPQLFFLHSLTDTQSTPQHCTHHTPHKHACVLSSFFLCDCQCTQSTLNQTTQHHAITTHGTTNE